MNTLPRLSMLAWVIACGNAAAMPVLPQFDIANFIPNAPITNTYFPALDNKTRIYLAEDANGDPVEERFEFTWVGPGKALLGVQTTTLRDRAYEDGLLVEDTFDYFAQDVAGNVWYFGEDVTNYVYDANGDLVSTNPSSSWLAGFNNAEPGYIMPANPIVGQSYYQEFAEFDDAVDQAEITATGLTIAFGGVDYTDVLQIYETTDLDPDAREFKYYAPGFGLIGAAENLDDNRSNPELIFSLAQTVPEPSSAMLLGVGLSLAAVARRSRRKTSG